ncbi:glycoside hydrolase family 28 protein [Echinicola jeungdonensis]|uniref:Glycoside hydrolase family 28 protein n=1 Tax=Echinicola jeungdonensis TaxID=709343 RepID=A0ABV5J897_9BACT|nr:glycoside hydrolase family 28 protein [Echinicola jeungdonensis]MDN3669502.1 glycoside hydrolase family 28 protein [Echinicola jeungdonensis]
MITKIIYNQIIIVHLLILSLLGCQENRTYNIRDFGATPDSTFVNTKTIQRVIDKCAANGGGTVIVPEGIFRSGALFFKQGVNLHIEKGGVLKGVVDENAYPTVNTRWEGIEREWISAFINAFDIDGFSISGKGTIDGSGVDWLNYKSWQELESGRPRLIAIQNCKNVSISGIKIKNQACWGVFVLYSQHVVIKDLVIRAEHHIPMSDGIDIDSSKDVLISNCDIDVNDDCIAIKSGKDEDGRRVNKPAENIIVEKCIFNYGHGGVSMGSEMSGGIRNVEIRDCIMSTGNWAPIRFKSQPSRGGVVENITYRNLELRNTRQAFEFNMEWRMVPPVKPPSDPLPIVRNVQIINVSGTVENAGIVHGLKESPIYGVVFENCHIKAKKGLVLENTENIDLSGLTIEVEEGKPIMQRNVTGE